MVMKMSNNEGGRKQGRGRKKKGARGYKERMKNDGCER
jgi:hypothetical protein